MHPVKRFAVVPVRTMQAAVAQLSAALGEAHAHLAHDMAGSAVLNTLLLVSLEPKGGGQSG